MYRYIYASLDSSEWFPIAAPLTDSTPASGAAPREERRHVAPDPGSGISCSDGHG